MVDSKAALLGQLLPALQHLMSLVVAEHRAALEARLSAQVEEALIGWCQTEIPSSVLFAPLQALLAGHALPAAVEAARRQHVALFAAFARLLAHFALSLGVPAPAASVEQSTATTSSSSTPSPNLDLSLAAERCEHTLKTLYVLQASLAGLRAVAWRACLAPLAEPLWSVRVACVALVGDDALIVRALTVWLPF